MIDGLNTRNPTPSEIRAYETASAVAEDAELDQLEYVTKLRGKYALPGEAGVDPQSGIFMMQGKRLAGNKHASVEEREQLYRLQNLVDTAKIATRRVLAKLRRDCDAPSIARLNSHYKWVTPEGEVIVEDEPVPVESAEPAPEAAPAEAAELA